MYCPVDIMSPFFTLEMKGIQRSKEVFVSLLYSFSVISLYTIRKCVFIIL